MLICHLDIRYNFGYLTGRFMVFRDSESHSRSSLTALDASICIHEFPVCHGAHIKLTLLSCTIALVNSQPIVACN